MNEKVALITGASGGIGKEIAEKMLNKGYKVYGASRTEQKLQYLAERENGDYILLDVADEKSRERCVAEVLARESRLDILINNAGYGLLGAVEDIELDKAREQFDVNLFGLAEMSRLVIPKMREQASGKIINISSIAGKTHIPFGGWYIASKHALEGLSDVMRNELKNFGIDVVIIEPGAIKTNWGNIAAENLLKHSGDGFYAEKAEKQAQAFKEMYSDNGMAAEADQVADTVIRAVESKKPSPRYTVPKQAGFMLFLLKILPDRAVDYLTDKIMN